jgi:hypothetical protein
LVHNSPGDHLGGATRSAQLVWIQAFRDRQVCAAGILEKVSQALFVIPALQETVHPHVVALLDHHWRAQITVCQNAKGEVTILYKKETLSYTIFQKAPRQAQVVDIKTLDRLINTPKPPADNHPWRHYGTHLNGKPIQEVLTNAVD